MSHKTTRFGAVTSVLAICLAAGAAQAQEPPETAEFYAGPPEIVLYDYSGFGGQSLTLNADAENLQRQNFNDRTSSIRVVSGNWEVCMDANFRSQCLDVTSDERNLGRFDNQISSVRVQRGGGGGGGGYGGRDGSITFYAGPNYTGQSVTLDSAVGNFNTIGFNDRARSARFDGRGSWRVCQHANYGGNCSEITGDVRDLSVIRLAGEISSAAPGGRGPGGPGGPGRPGSGYEPRDGVRLFDGRDFSGQRYDVQSDTYDLNRTGFNDRTESIAIARGETWEFCMDSNFRSQCRTFSESISDLGAYRFDNTISSLRRVGGGFPGGPGGPGGPGRPGGGYRGPIDGEVEGIGAAFFPVPEIRGYAIDRCLGSGGRDCDTAAADYICREAGYRQAAYFTVDRGRRYRTIHIGENDICRTGRCEAILNLTCVNE